MIFFGIKTSAISLEQIVAPGKSQLRIFFFLSLRFYYQIP